MALKVGIQIYSVRKNMAKNPLETIRKVAETGYKYLETANLLSPDDYGTGFGGSAKEIKQILGGFGSRIFSAHVFPLDFSNIDKVLDYYCELGTEYIHSKPLYGTVDDVKKQAELFNELGEKCCSRGIRYGIHSGFNTYCEDGSFSLDRMAEFTSANIFFEIDTYWIMRAGKDPAEIIKQYKNRIHIIHQKDCPKDFHGIMNMNSVIPKGSPSTHDVIHTVLKEDEFCEIGTGMMDLQKIIDVTLKFTEASYIVLEQDFTKLDEFESIKLSMSNFKKCKGLVFDGS